MGVRFRCGPIEWLTTPLSSGLLRRRVGVRGLLSSNVDPGLEGHFHEGIKSDSLGSQGEGLFDEVVIQLKFVFDVHEAFLIDDRLAWPVPVLLFQGRRPFFLGSQA